jgi:hypothetical protein
MTALSFLFPGALNKMTLTSDDFVVTKLTLRVLRLIQINYR